MRVPRRAAVVLSAIALTGGLAACNGGDGTADEPANDAPMTDPLAPGGGVEGEGEVESE